MLHEIRKKKKSSFKSKTGKFYILHKITMIRGTKKEGLHFRSRIMLQVTVKIVCYMFFAKRGEDDSASPLNHY